MISIPGYKIDKKIGSGGMAEVYLGYQESVDRPVAIKVMSPSLKIIDESFAKRFIKEANVGSISHKNIITVYDAGEIDGHHYIVMEYIKGGDLATLIAQNQLTLEQKINVIRQIAAALGYSYSKGFVHRDVKPENILFREDGSPVLADFGIAKALSSATNLTTSGTYMGSPFYMSPEQIRGHEVDHRSDLYSLGIVFFELLGGHKPYETGDTYAIGIKHISEPVPPLPSKYSEYQPIIDKMLAKEPYQRYQNSDQFISAIDSVFNPDGSTVVMPVINPAASSQKHQQEVHAAKHQSRNFKMIMTVSVLLTIVITVGVNVFFYFNPSKEAKTSVQSTQPIIGRDKTAQIENNGKQFEIDRKNLQIEKLLFRAEQLALHISINQENRESLIKIYEEILAIDDSNQAATMGLEMLSALYLQEAYIYFENEKVELAKEKLAKSISLVETSEAISLQRKIDQLEVKKLWQ